MLLLFATATAYAQVSRGTVQEGLTLDSKILATKVRDSVYLPFDYTTSNRYYPVVYLLHGYTDNDMGWIQFGEAHMIADEAIARRDIPPMIIVMPDAGVSWYINNFDGSVRFEDFFFQELIPHIEGRYRIRAEKAYRGVAGLSMGGFGTLVYLLRHPDVFAAGAALSAAVYTTEQIVAMDDNAWRRWPGAIYGPAVGEARLTEHLLSYNPIHLAETRAAEQLRSVRIYLDCGDDDFLTIGNAMLHVALTKRQIPHQYRVRDGAHTWSYWRSGLAEALKFIGTSFHKP